MPRFTKLGFWLPLLAFGCASSGGAERAPTRPSVATSDVWQRLTAPLLGHWHAAVARGEVDVTYTLYSDDSAMVEVFRGPSGRQTLSVYHVAGPHLMLTHYCAQKNQPRLVATAIDDQSIRFELEDVTDYDPGEAVMHVMVVTLHPGGFDQTATYRAADGTEETETLHFVRAPPE